MRAITVSPARRLPRVGRAMVMLGVTALVSAFAAACSDGDTPTTPTTPAGDAASLRVVNAFTTPIDIVIDGTVAAANVAAATIDTVTATTGAHTVAFRATSGTGGTSSGTAVTATKGALATIAAVRAGTGSIVGAILDDTNAVVPAGATKLRVLHLAPSAGELQVYRTQPDWQTPIRWQFPFTYQPAPTSLSAPFFQSTVGTWEVRVWQTPADSSGWAGAAARMQVPLAGGQMRTVVILDKPGGGVRLELF